MLNGNKTITFEWFCAGVAFVFVLLRLYVRVCSPENKHDRSDYIVVAAWLSFATCCACDLKLRNLGIMDQPGVTCTGDETKLLPNPEKNIEVLKLTYGSTFPYLIGLWLIKAGILSFYYTMIPRSLPRYRSSLHIIAGLCVLSFILVFLGNMFWCMPIKRNWSLDKEEFCVSTAMPPFFGFIGTIATDLMIFCFPIPLLRSMTLPRRKKIGVIFVFALGLLNILASVCRITAIAISATFPTVAVWTAVECSTGIMVACVPALRVLILRRVSRPPRNKSSLRYPGSSVLSTADRNEIWDGTDATAPEWIRMASLSLANNTITSQKAVQFDNSVNSTLSKQLAPPQKNSVEHGSGMSDFSMVTGTPSIRLQIGRGIVEHASMSFPTSPVSGHQVIGNSTSLPSSLSTIDTLNTNLVRLDGSDDNLSCVLNRWDTGESGRLELVENSGYHCRRESPGLIVVPNSSRSRLMISDTDPNSK